MKSGLFALVAMVCLAAPGLAQARPRDEVMAGAFRCAAIGDSRAWLDCYYGAAQPVRAQLGLSPAPAAQVQLALSPPPGNPADGSVRNSVVSGAFGCNAIADDRQWLDCYYGAAQPMRGRLGLSPAPQARPALPQQQASIPVPPSNFPAAPPPRKESGGWFSGLFGDDEEPVPEGQFGKPSRVAAGPSAVVDHVVSRMTAYSFDRFGTFTVTLANGQVWRQLSGDTDHPHWTKPASTYVVSISHGWFGSFNLTVKNNPGMFKVQRAR